MKPFIHDDFLLPTSQARALYHDYAEKLPIVDFHCHLPPGEIAADARWENMTRLWLGGDHYKWRAMRANGIDERFITGDAPDREKFARFAAAMPYLLRNPLFDWSHLELARYFGITDLLSPATEGKIWALTSERLAEPGFSARGLLTRSRVELVCTTDDPADTLESHAAVRASGFAVRVLPAWRPDKALAIARPGFWNAWLDRLGAAAGMDVRTWDGLLEALSRRHAFFAANGCRLSDYGVEAVDAPAGAGAAAPGAIFRKVRGGGRADERECAAFRSALLFEMLALDAKSGWTAQLHYGALRDNNTKMFRALGPDTGFDGIGDAPAARQLAALFDRLETAGALPRAIVYPLNPAHYETAAAMIGNFQRGPGPGRMQLGCAWWFNDHADGIARQLDVISRFGLLSRFAGMVTDSRSFLSYARHEYFRRILCGLLGADMAAGAIPDDIPWTGEIVRDICHRNAARLFAEPSQT